MPPPPLPFLLYSRESLRLVLRLLLQVGDHKSGLELFAKGAGAAARAFREMQYKHRRGVPLQLYNLVVQQLGCASRECENPAHARRSCACQVVVSRCVQQGALRGMRVGSLRGMRVGSFRACGWCAHRWTNNGSDGGTRLLTWDGSSIATKEGGEGKIRGQFFGGYVLKVEVAKATGGYVSLPEREALKKPAKTGLMAGHPPVKAAKEEANAQSNTKAPAVMAGNPPVKAAKEEAKAKTGLMAGNPPVKAAKEEAKAQSNTKAPAAAPLMPVRTGRSLST